MGAGVFHGRVRDGIGCGNSAIGTRPPNRNRFRWMMEWLVVCEVNVAMGFGAACGASSPEGGEAVMEGVSLSGD